MPRARRARRIRYAVALVVLLGGGAGLVWALRAPSPPSPGEGGGEAAPDPTRGGLSGTVVDGDSGAGIATARVSLQCGDAPPREEAVDENGAYGFDDLAPGLCEVRAFAPEHGAGGRREAAAARVRIRAGRTLPDVQLSLYRVGSVQGRVLLDGRGVADAHLSVLYAEAPGENEAFSIDVGATSGPDGNFTLVGLWPGRLQVLAELDGYALAESREVFLESGGALRGVDIVLGGAAVIQGRIVDPDGRPVPGGEARLFAAGARHPRRASADESGRFLFEGVAAGAYELSAQAPGFLPAAPVQGTLEAGDVAELVVAVRRAEGLTGVVRDPSGLPVRGAAVVLLPLDAADVRGRPAAFSDENGQFVVPSRLPAEPFAVRASHPQYGPSAVVAVRDGGVAPVELVLTSPGGIAGRVVSAATGAPVTTFEVWIVGYQAAADSRPQPGGGFGRRLVRDPAGEFVFEPLAPGVYRLEVRAPGHTSQEAGGLVVQAGARADAGVIALLAGARIVGRVVDGRSGEPLAHASVRTVGIGFHPAFAATDEQGAFVLPAVPAERLSVQVGHAGYATEVVSAVEPPAGGEIDLGTVALDPAGPEGGGFRYGGMGAVLALDEGRLVVQEAFADAPAAQAGLAPGTEILRIDGYAAAELGLRRSVELIRGAAGSEMTLEVLRPGSNYPETLRIQRSRVSAPSDVLR